MRRLCFSITILAALVMLKHNLHAADEPPFYLAAAQSMIYHN